MKLLPTQIGKRLARLRTALRAICAMAAKPTTVSSWAHGSIYVFAQAGMDVKVIFQELRSSDIHIYTHCSGGKLSSERGPSCGLSQNWAFPVGKPVIGSTTEYKSSQPYLSAFCTPGTLLGPLHSLSHSILRVNLGSRDYIFLLGR